MRERAYVERAQALGAGDWHMITRHILPNVFPVIFANTILIVATAILSETTLSFLGLGDRCTSPGARSSSRPSTRAPPPGRVVVAGRRPASPSCCVVVAFTMCGYAMDDILNPKLDSGDERSPAAPMTAVLSVRDLHVAYKTQAGPVPAVRGVDFEIQRGEVARPGRRVGVREVHDRRRHPAPAAGGHDGHRRRQPAGGRRPGDEARPAARGPLGAAPPSCSRARCTRSTRCAASATRSSRRSTIHREDRREGGDCRVGDLLEHVGLPARRMRDYPHELSGGQKQRVMIAMALACDPSLVIADEPTTALDVMVQAQVLKLLKSLQGELGLAMLFITHDLSVLTEVSDRLAIMYAGKIVEEGPARDVFRDPQHPYTRALAGAFPEIGDQRFRRAPAGLGGDPPDPADIPSGCSFHPRCPEAFDACPGTEPDLFQVGEGHRAACLLHTPLAAASRTEAP